MADKAKKLYENPFKTRAEVDAFAVRVAKHDAEGTEIDNIKKQIRKSIGAGGNVEGKAFIIMVSEAPEKHEKVDYRALLLQYMKQAGVEKPAATLAKLEQEAEEEVTDYGTPRVTIEANPNFKPE